MIYFNEKKYFWLQKPIIVTKLNIFSIVFIWFLCFWYFWVRLWWVVLKWFKFIIFCPPGKFWGLWRLKNLDFLKKLQKNCHRLKFTLLTVKSWKNVFGINFLAETHLHMMLLGQKPSISAIHQLALNHGSSFQGYENFCHDFWGVFGVFSARILL